MSKNNIFDIYNYIIEADDNSDTDFTTDEAQNDDDMTEEDTTDDTDFTDGADNDTDTNETDEEGEGEESTEENPDDGAEDDGYDDEDPYGDDGTEETEEEPVDLRAKEDELYSSFTPAELAIRNREMKDSFDKLYDFIGLYITRIVDTKKSSSNVKVLDYCEDRLVEVKELTYNYIVHNFAMDSYIQKKIMHKRILLTISKIIDLLDKISHESKTNG